MTTNQLIVEMSQIISVTAISMWCSWLLVTYRLNKKFKLERTKNWKEWLDANWVEVTLFMTIVPQWPQAVRAILSLVRVGS